ncbi:STAS domain protein [Posidoniimonas polymericola]|uniref:Anti-sigma factor antagonist n=1 Tax=Posidoniimonas polymericola TaxID=2528002 RepID=A0A5C5YMS4_9BACT|nr:STAS domain-containing protein [Posidoniimonas polymericola]TWT76140.1 STAS domain protein [Posidoniimonas polymericola]
MPTLHRQGCVDVVTLDDRFSIENVDQALTPLNEALAAGIPQLVIDMRRVKFVDSAGLELLCKTHADCRRRGGELWVSAPSRLVRDVFGVTGLDARLQVADDVLTAAGEFTK